MRCATCGKPLGEYEYSNSHSCDAWIYGAKQRQLERRQAEDRHQIEITKQALREIEAEKSRAQNEQPLDSTC